MKKILSLFIAAAAALNLGSCTENRTALNGKTQQDDTEPLKGTNETSTEVPHDEVTLDGRIAFADENGIYFTYSDSVGKGGFRMLDVQTAKIMRADGTECGADTLVSGMPVSVEFDGNVLETYPERIAPTRVVLGDEAYSDNILGMFLSAFDNLFESDSGLNDEIKYIAFDLSGLNRLNEGEKEAFIWKASSKYGLEPLVGDHDKLLNDGYIADDDGFTYFTDGVLISFSDTEPGGGSGDAFEFEMSKWRSGLGAIFLGCSAEKTDGKWSYENESFAIS